MTDDRTSPQETPEAEYVKKVVKALRAGHQYSGIVDKVDKAAADLIETLYLASLARVPAAKAASSIDHLQQRGRCYDIIQQAIADYDEWMLDDDYDAMSKLHGIMGQMRARLALAEPEPHSPAATSAAKALSSELNALRLKAFASNSDADKGVYFDRLSRAFQCGELVPAHSPAGNDPLSLKQQSLEELARENAKLREQIEIMRKSRMEECEFVRADCARQLREMRASVEGARACLDVTDEGIEILVGLAEEIKRKGHYSVESTATFLDQAASCFREIKRRLALSSTEGKQP